MQPFEIFIGPDCCVPAPCPCVGPIRRAQGQCRYNENQTDGEIQVTCHVGLVYFFEEPGGKFLNIFSTSLSMFWIFLLELLDSVSLELPLQTSCLVFASNKSTTRVPTVYV